MKPVHITEIAATLHIDRRHLTRLFLEEYGKTPQAYLMELRLTQARVLLRRDCGVTETAAMAGFPDLSDFSKYYKAF